MQALLDELVGRLGASAVLTDPADLATYGTDRCRGPWAVAPVGIAMPASVEEVQHVVRACVAHRVAIVPSGGRTGLCGGATATHGELVVSLGRMRRIDAVDPT